MPFTKPIPGWNKEGVEPPQSLKDIGFVAGSSPAAGHFDWLFYTISEAIQELQQNGYTQNDIAGILDNYVQSNSASNWQKQKLTDDNGFATTQTDLNNITGTKTIALGTNVANCPFDYGTVYQVSNSDNTKSQIAIDNSTGALSARSYNSAGGWSAWKNYVNQSSFGVWIPLSLYGGVVGGSSGTNAYLVDTLPNGIKKVTVKLAINTVAIDTPFATIPVGFRPPESYAFLANTTGGIPFKLGISTDGTMSLANSWSRTWSVSTSYYMTAVFSYYV